MTRSIATRKERKKLWSELTRKARNQSGACVCRTVTITHDPMRATITRKIGTLRSAHQGSPLPCKHHYVQDRWTGKITNDPKTPRIGPNRPNGLKHARFQSQQSPWNRQGPVSRFELS